MCYINEDGELVRIKPFEDESEPEVVLENVEYIYHLFY